MYKYIVYKYHGNVLFIYTSILYIIRDGFNIDYFLRVSNLFCLSIWNIF